MDTVLVHRYYRLCYQKFTNVSKQLEREVTTNTDSLSQIQYNLKRRCMSGYSGTLLPSDSLFCYKLREMRKGKNETIVKCETLSATNLIMEKPLIILDYDIQVKVNDIDLVQVREAYNHRSCYNLFTHEDRRISTESSWR